METMNHSQLEQSLTLTEEDKKQAYWEQFSIGSNVTKPLLMSFLGKMETSINQLLEQFKVPSSGLIMKFENGRQYMKKAPFEGNAKKQKQEHLQLVRPMFPNLNERLHTILEESFSPFFEEVDHALKQELTFEEARTLVNDTMEVYQEAFPRQVEVLFPYQQLRKDLETLYQQCTGDQDTTVIYDLLVGVWNETLEMNQQLWELAQRVKHDDSLKQVFLHASPENLKNELSRTRQGRRFWIDFQQFLETYGYKTIHSRDFTSETWLEHPNIALSTLANEMENNESVNQQFQQTVEERKRKYDEILNQIPEGEHKETFKQYYQWALASANIDDDHHFYMDDLLTAKVRLLLLHVGDMLVTHNVIADREDVFHLYFDELQEVLEHPENLFDLMEERHAEYQENLQKEVPSSYGTPPQELETDMIAERATGSVSDSESATDEQSLKGLAGSKGTYTGPVKVLISEEEFSKLEKGDVLIAHITTPSWTVLFSRVGAIITDVGGILSHPGINAREYQVPAVLGTKNATNRLKDGDVVTVDGTNGWVTVDEQA